jgi:hypothetical protein
VVSDRNSEKTVTFIPDIPHTLLKIDPTEIKLLEYTRATVFRVSANKNIDPGEYTIKWKTTGDSEPATYSPMEDTVITVLNNKVVSFQIDDIPEMPAGSTSVPIKVSTPNAPDSGVQVTVGTKGGTGTIEVTPKELRFAKNEWERTFVIEVEDNFNATNTEVTFALSGDNKDSFRLPSASKKIKIADQDNVAPKLVYLADESLPITSDRTTLTLNIEADKVGTMYWTITDPGGFPYPSHTEMKA